MGKTFKDRRDRRYRKPGQHVPKTGGSPRRVRTDWSGHAEQIRPAIAEIDRKYGDAMAAAPSIPVSNHFQTDVLRRAGFAPHVSGVGRWGEAE